jgi:small-conductance mechanosensitive channel
MRMSRTQLIVGALVLALLAATGIGYLMTAHPPSLQSSGKRRLRGDLLQVLRDRLQFENAMQNAMLADTDGERNLADQAVRLSDQILDQSLQEAMSNAERDSQSADSAGRALMARVHRLEQTIAGEKSRQAQMQAELPHVSPSRRNDLQGEIAIIDARLQLEQAQLNDARADALRSASTDVGMLQQIAQDHQANHGAASTHLANRLSLPPGITIPVHGLADAVSVLYRLHQKDREIDDDRSQAALAIQRLLQQHAALDSRLHQEEQQSAENAAQPQRPRAASPRSDQKKAANDIDRMHRLTQEQSDLTGFDEQVQREQQLDDVYDRWQTVTARQRTQTLHILFRELIKLIVFLCGLIILDGLAEHLSHRLHREESRISTLRRLTRVGCIIAALIGTLLLAFGRPQQLATILGLAGAGLTVAFEDGLLSMAGWFILMGRNGVAIGDWVEINGVVGEVIEIGLVRTVLLETGNWTEPGHPTGRKVFCPNAFVFRSAYFNFTSTRKWLWDEIQIALPADLDPRSVAGQLAKEAQGATGVDAEAAALDYRRSVRLRTLHAVPTAPLVELRPGPSGLLICIRYVTTAERRAEVRDRLYRAILTTMERERSRSATAASAELSAD